MPLRLRWDRTWPDKPEDFVCFDGDNPVGRIYSEQVPGGLAKHWRWFLNGFLPDRRVYLNQTGYAATKNDAAHEAEDAYFREKGET
jgi:hypothetical protein